MPSSISPDERDFEATLVWFNILLNEWAVAADMEERGQRLIVAVSGRPVNGPYFITYHHRCPLAPAPSSDRVDTEPLPLAMDIPFVSSGALSRAHYAIVRKVECATSPQEANTHLSAEIKLIARQFQTPVSIVRNNAVSYRLVRLITEISRTNAKRDS